MNILLLLGGFIALLLSGDLLVRGGVSLAGHFRVSKLVIGMTVVSLGTSAPELVVSLQSVFSGHSDISIGTVIGSNMSNIGFILGMAVMILPMTVSRITARRDAPVMFLATVMLFVFVRNGLLDRSEGIVFVILLVGYLVFSIGDSRRIHRKEPQNQIIPHYVLWKSILLVLAAIIGLRYGAQWLVNGATGIARQIGISEYAISLTVVAVGTSLPELATSLVAAIKKENDISIGNIIGSNLFNIWGILGITASFRPININARVSHIDIYWLLAISALLLLFMLLKKRIKINRVEGAVLFTGYLLYLVFVFV
ncbi:MAG: calcium/sodium antiporter [Bacteroidales bacterium]|nr:calcium/sodium antiporter [Bacteroidales bacterium]